ncbi:hypothetical protein Pint_16330 [Pistacia integerrima]|uniref:Uncharacterized protein n=1 Tax=Pistacia integerrima TaxID=434235 RepID=A0ACC0ZES3_9ROSI|nr:hypothetical protein Pint_16330 [Pistacia integerrima]
MDFSTKKMIMEDLSSFVKRKEFYKREVKSWKIEYLLFSPSVMRKSRLTQAMTNFLNFNIYELKLIDIRRNSELLNMLITTRKNSILVVKDCSTKLPTKHEEGETEATEAPKNLVTLSRLLNLLDGLWSSGDGRIIMFMRLTLNCCTLVAWICMSTCSVTFILYSKSWFSIFDTLAMDLSTKKKIMEDLERFVNRKEFYKREEKAWKREYMLLSPSIAAKSRLIQAMTNFSTLKSMS